MKKELIAVIAIVIIIALAIGGVLALTRNSGAKSSVKFETAQDAINLVDKIYEKSGNEMFGLETRQIELDDEFALSTYTGLSNSENIDMVVVSESMIMSTPYSLALVKVKNGADVEAIKKEMVDNIDMRRWICVSADELYATNSGNVIFVVMASKEDAKPQYDAFKEVVGGKFGKELTKEAEPIVFDFDETVPPVVETY